MAGYSEARSTLKGIEVPRDLVGKPAGVFFLLNEIERRKSQSKSATDSGRFELKPFMLVDEFIFNQRA